MPVVHSFDNTPIYYEYTPGEKETIVFVHGWGLNRTTWHKEAQYLRKHGYGTILFDLRGHGKSGWRDGDVHMNQFVQDAYHVLQECNVTSCIMVGHSFGGMVCFAFAEKYSAYLQRIVAVDTSYENPVKHMSVLKHIHASPLVAKTITYILTHEHIKKKHFASVDFSSMKPTHTDMYYFLQGAKHMYLQAILGTLKTMLEYDETALLPKLTIPVLVIEGELDKKTPPKVAKHMVDCLPNGQLLLLPGTGHDAVLNKPDRVSKIVLDFITTTK